MSITLDQALEQRLYKRIALVTGETWSVEAEAAWRQGVINRYRDNIDEECYCIPSMSTGAWLPAPLIEARMTVLTPVLRLELPPDYLYQARVDQLSPFLEALSAQLAQLDLTPHFAFGSDFARSVDLSTGSLMAIEQRLKRREVLAYELRNVPGDEQKLIAKTVLNHVRHRLVGAAFDATGMGWTVAEDMGRIFGLREDPEGAGLIMAVKFSEEWYRLNMPPLKAAFEDDMIALIKDADHLSDLRAIKLVRGIARVPVLREGEAGRKRHGDHAIAVALAHYASRLRWVEYGYRPAAPAQTARQGRLSMRADDTADVQTRDPWRPPLGAGLREGI